MTPPLRRTRVLNPLERFSEIVFSLIMVLTFTCAINVAQAGRADVAEMLIGAIGCNLAWGIIDGAFYLIGSLAEKNRNLNTLRRIQNARNLHTVRPLIHEAIPPWIATSLTPADYERFQAEASRIPLPEGRSNLGMDDWLGGIGVFLLVFLSTFPVILPFFFLQDAWVALRVSNLVAIVMLYGAGHMLARYAGLRSVPTGAAMVAIGVALVGLAMVLGG